METKDILKDVKKNCKDFIHENKNWIIIIRGTTATGKTWLSVLLSEFFPIEVISADSRQVFKYMDIGTDKVSKDIMKKLPHHQIDIVNPDEPYTAWEWKTDTENLITQIQRRWNIPFVVWWTWLYIDTIYKNFKMPEVQADFELREKLYKQEEQQPWYLHKELGKIDPQEAIKIHPKSTRYLVRALEIYYKTWNTKTHYLWEQLVKWPMLMIGLWREKEDANKRINKRIKEMMNSWLIDEVKWLLEKWYSPDLQSMQWIWYKEIVWYINWEYNLEKAQELLKRNTHNYAKRQRTWFRRYIIDSRVNPKENVIYKLYNLSWE